MRVTQLLANLPLTLSAEQFDPLLTGGKFRLERIVSVGHASPPDQWYDQEEDEWVLILAGAAELEFSAPAERVKMEPGEAILISAHRRHRVAWTDPTVPTVWLALHFDAAANPERDARE